MSSKKLEQDKYDLVAWSGSKCFSNSCTRVWNKSSQQRWMSHTVQSSWCVPGSITRQQRVPSENWIWCFVHPPSSHSLHCTCSVIMASIIGDVSPSFYPLPTSTVLFKLVHTHIYIYITQTTLSAPIATYFLVSWQLFRAAVLSLFYCPTRPPPASRRRGKILGHCLPVQLWHCQQRVPCHNHDCLDQDGSSQSMKEMCQ